MDKQRPEPIVPAVAPPASRAPRGLSWNLATGSIALSVVGAGTSVLAPGLFLFGVSLFVLGLIAGVVAFRSGVRRNLAIGGIVLNALNLAVDAAFVLYASRH